MEQQSNAPTPKRGKTLGFVIISIVLVAVFGLGMVFSNVVLRNEVVAETYVEVVMEVETVTPVNVITHTTWIHDMDWFFAYPRTECTHWHCWHRENCGDINGWFRNGNWEINRLDNAGNAHVGGIFSGTSNRHSDNGHSITYLINGEYFSFSGYIALAHGSREAQQSYSIHIYADNVRVFSTPTITGGVAPIFFDIDVTGVEQVRIVRNATGSAEIGILSAGFHR